MKKFLCFVLTVAWLGVNTTVYAKTTPNGVNIEDYDANASYTSLYCYYSNNVYVSIQETDHLEVLPEASDTRYLKLPFVNYDYAEMRAWNFLNENDEWDCPLYAQTDSSRSKIISFSNQVAPNSYPLNKNKSNCLGKAAIYQESSNTYTCSYSGNSGSLKVEGSGNKCTVTYPDGSTQNITNGVCSMTSKDSCPDLYYNKSTKELKWATYDYAKYFEENNKNNYDMTMYDMICKDNQNIDYLCNGTCEFPANQNINCSKIEQTIYQGELCYQPGVAKSFRFFGYLLFIAKVIIPIILIATGSMDFAKALTSSNQDALTKSTRRFALRIVTGVVVFLLPTIIYFFFNLIPTDDSAHKNCSTCLFRPNQCNISS